MNSIYIKFIFCCVLLSALSLHSCTLDEYNPGAFTKEALATSIDGYETLINQCYFAMERFYYGAADWMSLTEGDTDLWTYKANESTSYTQWFWFFAGTSPNTTYTNNWWNGTYDETNLLTPRKRNGMPRLRKPVFLELCIISMQWNNSEQ